MPLHLPKIIGHRGACYYAPENTIASLKKAHELHIGWIEFDVMLTKDTQAIVFHDDTLDRTTNGAGLVADTDYEKIAALDAGSWFSPTFCDEKVPLFADYLTHAKQLGLGVNVEIKPTSGKEKETAKKVVEILQQHWTNPALLLVSSFSMEVLKKVRELDQQLHLALLINHWMDDWHITQELQCSAINIKHTVLTAEKVQALKSYVSYVLAYTVNDKENASKLFEMGVDGIFSDRPDIFACKTPSLNS